MWGKRTQTTGLKMILDQSAGAKAPFFIAKPTGACIKLWLTMIQKAERVVPSATMPVDSR